MYSLNKIIGYLVSPVGFSIALVLVAAVANMLGRRRVACWSVLLALANFWLWSTPWMTQWIGAPLEAEFLVEGRMPAVESLPAVEAIVLHGGGMGNATNIGYQAEMWTSADRVWHAARLWNAGKAPKIYATGTGVEASTKDLLVDFGVPAKVIAFVDEPRNTEEEAKAINRLFGCSMGESKPKVLVVTSAWHMKRTLLMYQKYAPGVVAIPAPCDFENTLAQSRASGWMAVLPDPAALLGNSVAFKEWLGYCGYRWFR